MSFSLAPGLLFLLLVGLAVPEVAEVVRRILPVRRELFDLCEQESRFVRFESAGFKHPANATQGGLQERRQYTAICRVRTDGG